MCTKYCTLYRICLLENQKEASPANIVVTPSDALVINTSEFRRVMEKALRFTDDSSAIVTIGIRPTRPETGYGYIAAANQLQTDKEIYTVDAFKEKPDKETAEKYLAEGNYFWNAGIFVWNVRTITSVMRVLLRVSHRFLTVFSRISIRKKKMKQSKSYSRLAKVFLSTMR